MKITYNGLPVPEINDSIGFARTINTDTGEMSEQVDIEFEIASLDGSVADAIAMLTELQNTYQPQFNEGVHLVHFSDWEDVSLTVEARRTLHPGDALYPETFTPYLDRLYPKRTWREADASAGGSASTLIRLDDLKEELEMESYLASSHTLVNSHPQEYADAMQWVFSVDKERKNLGLEPGTTVRFGINVKDGVAVAQIFDEPGEPTYRTTDLPDEARTVPGFLQYLRSGMDRRMYGNVTVVNN